MARREKAQPLLPLHLGAQVAMALRPTLHYHPDDETEAVMTLVDTPWILHRSDLTIPPGQCRLVLPHRVTMDA